MAARCHLPASTSASGYDCAFRTLKAQYPPGICQQVPHRHVHSQRGCDPCRRRSFCFTAHTCYVRFDGRRQCDPLQCPVRHTTGFLRMSLNGVYLCGRVADYQGKRLEMVVYRDQRRGWPPLCPLDTEWAEMVRTRIRRRLQSLRPKKANAYALVVIVFMHKSPICDCARLSH